MNKYYNYFEEKLDYLKKEGNYRVFADLEKLANHKGSIFGSQPNGQPSQKRFESEIHNLMKKFNPQMPIYIESESSKIGYLKIPPALWKKMKSSPHFELSSNNVSRAKFLSSQYPELYKDTKKLLEKIELLKEFHKNETIIGWKNLIEKKDFRNSDCIANRQLRKLMPTLHGHAPLSVLLFLQC